MPAGISRRSFLATGAAAALSACAARRQGRSQARSIAVANHPLYIDGAANPGFESATGIHVDYHEEIIDDGPWVASITPQMRRGQSIDRDVAIVSDWAADLLARQQWLDAEPQARTTWALGMVGLAYDVKAVGTELTHIAELFQPPLHGRVALPTDMRLTLGMALLADHFDPSTVTVEQAGATAARLTNSVKLGQVLSFAPGRPIDRLVAGEAAAVVAPASDTVGLEQDHPDIRFVVPGEGGLLLTDVAVIPVNGPNPDDARQYLRYTDAPDHAAERFRVLPVMWPRGGSGDGAESQVESRLRTLAPDVVADARRNPPADVRRRLRTFRFLDDHEQETFKDLFAGVLRPTR